MSVLMDRIASGQVLVGDGAMGTMLMQRGLPSGECPERWNLDRPEVLEDIARAYFEVGADLIETNTFGGSGLRLVQYGLEAQVAKINTAAVKAVRKVVGSQALVSGSCGPTGRMLKPHGDVDPEVMADSFSEQIGSLISSGVDLIGIETMTDLAEATLAIRAVRKLSNEIPLCATMTFDATPRGFYTVMGVTVKQAVAGLIEAGADVIGSNCGSGIENMVALAIEFRKLTDHPLIIQSNAGLPELRDGQFIYSESPSFMAEQARSLIDTGVNIIGGCCGTTPAHIAALRELVNRHNATL